MGRGSGHESPWGEQVFIYHVFCSLHGCGHCTLEFGTLGFFLCKIPGGDQGLQDLKNKIPTSHGFLSKLFDEIHFCPLFLKLQMFVVPNLFSPHKTVTGKPLRLAKLSKLDNLSSHCFHRHLKHPENHKAPRQLSSTTLGTEDVPLCHGLRALSKVLRKQGL